MASYGQTMFQHNFSFEPSRRTHHATYQASVSPFAASPTAPAVSANDLSLLAQQFGQHSLGQQRAYTSTPSSNHVAVAHSYTYPSGQTSPQYSHSQHCIQARVSRQPIPYGQCAACSVAYYQQQQQQLAQQQQQQQQASRQSSSDETEQDEGFEEPSEDENDNYNRLAYRRSTDFTGGGRVSRPIRRRKRSRLGQE